MSKRHEAIGIKQVVRLEWYDYALDMLLNERPAKEIRVELDAFIRERQQAGGYGERGAQTYVKAVTQIMNAWVTPSPDLVSFRNVALASARHMSRDVRIVHHWAVTIAAYPFWHRVAEQVGRLLNLQESVTQGQIRLRCFEAMGERSTVERSARRVIRTFVAWEALRDSTNKGCYARSSPIRVTDPNLATLLLEAALHATPEARAGLPSLLHSPAFFAFDLPVLSGDFIAQNNDRVDVGRYGLDDTLLQLKGTS